jgi:hypothetical protein
MGTDVPDQKWLAGVDARFSGDTLFSNEGICRLATVDRPGSCPGQE